MPGLSERSAFVKKVDLGSRTVSWVRWIVAIVFSIIGVLVSVPDRVRVVVAAPPLVISTVDLWFNANGSTKLFPIWRNR